MSNKSQEIRRTYGFYAEEISYELIAKGYKALEEVLEQYKDVMCYQDDSRAKGESVLKVFVLVQNQQLGQYAPESDNLDALNDDQLIALALDNNKLLFEKRMVEGNKALASQKQLDYLRKEGVKITDELKKNKFECSRMIQHIIDTKKPSMKQLDAINSMADKLGVSYADLHITNQVSATVAIEKLIAMTEEQPASDNQKDFIQKLFKMLKMRMTKERKELIANITSINASKLIKELRDKYDKEHPECTEGQAKFLSQLLDMFRLPYNMEELKLMTKVACSEKIEELQRKRLSNYAKAGFVAYNQEDIKSLDYEEVRNIIRIVQEERRTAREAKDYKDPLAQVAVAREDDDSCPFEV